MARKKYMAKLGGYDELSFVDIDWEPIEKHLGRELNEELRMSIWREIDLNRLKSTGTSWGIDQESLDKLNRHNGNSEKAYSVIATDGTPVTLPHISKKDGKLGYYKEDQITLPIAAEGAVPFGLNIRQFCIWKFDHILTSIGCPASLTMGEKKFTGAQAALRILVNYADPNGNQNSVQGFRKDLRDMRKIMGNQDYEAFSYDFE